MKIVFAFILGSWIISLGHAVAQSPFENTLKWEVSNVESVRDGATFPIEGAFVSEKMSNIQLVQKGGKVTYDFSVVSIEGNWESVSAEGKLICKVKMEEREGIMIFSKTGTSLSVEVSFEQESGSKFHHIFHVSTIRLHGN